MVTNTGATESGEDVVVNQHYQTVATAAAARTAGSSRCTSSMIVGHDAWVTANKNIPSNLSSYGGAYNGAMIDAAVQEYDLRTRQAAAQLGRARAHPARATRYATVPTNGFPWDAYHVNAIDLRPATARFLVSMRDTWAAYLVNIDTGTIDLDARRQALELQVRPPGADFQWQHDVR